LEKGLEGSVTVVLTASFFSPSQSTDRQSNFLSRNCGITVFFSNHKKR
jgi:hypothetical protein